MIRKLLIANRGEVAGRIITTCRRLGIRTVAVFSEADREALYVRLADEAVYLGPSPPSDSYLNIEAVLAAARRSGADAIHPGYGFLAENAEFARAVTESGLLFVGPRAEVIEKMGSKVAARDICREAGVPTVPGSGALPDGGLLAWAEEHGYPVMLKASAGGGGKGMRRLSDRAALEQAVASARREAEKAFGSDALYLEKAVVHPRHLEVQIAGDSGGQVVHLGVRECSLQRRHQKIIEESPPVNIAPAIWEGLTSAALTLARAVNYTSLGTVEFLVEGENFYFLEMNTRLQVEHPVTEMITGLDLVELQLNLAEGRPLGFNQADVAFKGHAVEARITCETPYNGFLPAVGTVLDWRPCQSTRFDSTLESGATVSPYYDSMVAKVVAWGEDRGRALRRLESALGSTVLLGVANNIDYLRRLLRLLQVEEGRQHTELVESLNWEAPEVSRESLLAAAAARWSTAAEGTSHFALPVTLTFQGHPPITVQGERYSLDGRDYTVKVVGAAVEIEGHRLPVAAAERDGRWWVHTGHGTVCLQAEERLPVPKRSGEGGGRLTAPMPGSVVEVLVSGGQRVEAGQTLLKLEAMKMEQIISAPSDGVVEKLLYQAGDQVDAGALLLEFTEG